MKVLNLTNNETSDIKFEVSKFPDGQQQVKIINFKENYHHYRGYNEYTEAFHPIKIKSRLNNFKDLELIICATKSLRNLGVREIHLYTPYFLGSRSDRKFEEGSNNYLKDVICSIINSLNFESVTVLDPHSDVLEACLNNFKKINKSIELLDLLYLDKLGSDKTKGGSFDKVHDLSRIILVSPDAGANKKIFKVAEQIGYTGEIITCSKSRDENGKLSRVEVPYNFKQYNNNTKRCPDLIIIDDICDGGATFINIAKKIREQMNPIYKVNIYLIVTHGIFSKGFSELSKYFDGIYCTNSYSNINLEDNEDLVFGDDFNVKQLNVF